MESVEMEVGTAEVRLLFPPAAGKDTRLLLDCRTIEEYATAKIIGSMLIPMQDIPARLAELEPWREKQIVVHCHHGMRSLKVAEWLRKQGFLLAQSMRGGIDEWSREIDPSVPQY
ncbi:MAG: rhodanese-like domain-containing protein [Planctomycetia bacterium]|nr:rhodanese-like domain-containing protein [Planctomycetia bacterium]